MGATYAAIGVAAPLIIMLARLLQGFATGGEFASATSFLIERAPAHRRGFYGSWQMVGQGLAVLIGALLGALITRNLATETLDSWGWRVPFLLGLVIGPVGSSFAVIFKKPRRSLRHAELRQSNKAPGLSFAWRAGSTFACDEPQRQLERYLL